MIVEDKYKGKHKKHKKMRSNTLYIKDSYTFYRNDRKGNLPNLDYKEERPLYIDITMEFVKRIANKILDGYDVIMPAGMGIIGVRGEKLRLGINEENGYVKGMLPNWKETKELWERDEKAKEEKTLVFYFNEHSNGIKYQFFWSKDRVLIKNKFIYGLRMARANKRELSRRIIEEEKEYKIRN